jgi:hypothetical protein
VDLNLMSLEEVSSQDGAVLQAIDLQTGTFNFCCLTYSLISHTVPGGFTVGWTMEQKNGSATGGNTTKSIFTSQLDSATGGANNATLQYYFDTFNSDSLITTSTACSPSYPSNLTSIWATF